MREILFAALALVSAYFITLGLSVLRAAGELGSLGPDVLVGATCLTAGLLLAYLGYVLRPE